MYMMILYCLMQIIKIFIFPSYKTIKRISIKNKKVWVKLEAVCLKNAIFSKLAMIKEDKIFFM